MSGDCVIYIVDDEAPVRASLAFLLISSGYTARAHESAAAFLQSIGSGKKACLITDLRMPEMNGVELLQVVRKRGIDIPVIVITGHGDVSMAVAAMKAGAVDFIEKPFADDVLLEAIGRAMHRLPPSGDMARSVEAIRERLDDLSPREREVLKGLVDGLPNKTIAYDLSISPRTVEVHRANIMAKMQARSLPDLVRMSLAMERAHPDSV